MLNITINYETIELLQFFWETAAKRNKVNDSYIMEIANHPTMAPIYNDTFDEQSVRKVLSAVINYEPVNEATELELEYYQFNKFNADDPGNVEMMLPPIKQLNLDRFKETIADRTSLESIQVHFVAGYDQSYWIQDNILTLNYFKIEADWSDLDHVFIEGVELEEFVQQKLLELIEA